MEKNQRKRWVLECVECVYVASDDKGVVVCSCCPEAQRRALDRRGGTNSNDDS